MKTIGHGFRGTYIVELTEDEWQALMDLSNAHPNANFERDRHPDVDLAPFIKFMKLYAQNLQIGQRLADRSQELINLMTKPE